MNPEEKTAFNKTKNPGTAKTASVNKLANIERGIEDIFRKIETRPDSAPKEQKIISNVPEIRIDTSDHAVTPPRPQKTVPPPKTVKAKAREPKDDQHRPKRFRLAYVIGILLIIISAVVFVVLLKQQPAPPTKPVAISVPPEPVQAVPEPSIEPPVAETAELAQPNRDSRPNIEEVQTVLMNWKTAWEHTAGKNGDLEAYMSFYADDFNSQGMDKSSWRIDKAQKNRLKDWIQLELKNIRLLGPVTPDRVTVGFLLVYNSSNYSDETHQILTLIKDADSWKIIQANQSNEQEIFDEKD